MSRYNPSMEARQRDASTLESFEKELGFKPDDELKSFLSNYDNTDHGSNEFFGLSNNHLDIVAETLELRKQGLPNNAVPLLNIGDAHYEVYQSGKVGEWAEGKFIGAKKSYSDFIKKYITDVSQEGFFSSAGKFLAAVGSSIGRANSIAYIDFEPDARPEVNGKPKKDYNLLLTSIKNEIGSGQPWDLTIVAKQYVYHDTGIKVGDNPLTEKLRVKKRTVAVILGEGRNIKVRLPGYRDGDGSAIVALLLIEDLNLKRIE